MLWLLPELPAVDLFNKCLLFRIRPLHIIFQRRFTKLFTALIVADFPNGNKIFFPSGGAVFSLENLYLLTVAALNAPAFIAS